MTEGPAPTVSIVITCYNYGRYLAEAIDSALAQTLPAAEVIIVNDGSTDDTLTIAEGYAQRSAVVSVIDQRNQGLATASNNGIRASSGEFFVRLDADDRLDPRHLERTVPLLASKLKKGYVYTGYQYFGTRDDVVRARPFSAKKLAFRPSIVATTLIRRAAFDAVGGYSAEMRRAYEDWDLYLSLSERGWYGIHLDEVLFYYRRRPGSMISITFREWVSLMATLYRRHRALYREPFALLLGRAIVDRIRSRIGARLAGLRAPS